MKVDLKELLDILGEEDEEDSLHRFIPKANEYLSKNAVKAILATDESVKRKYQSLYRLAWIVFSERQVRYYKEEPRFELHEDFCRLQKFLSSWDFLRRKKTIPFEEWSDIAEEGLGLVKQYFDKNVKSFEQLPGYETFMRKFGKRVTDLVNSGKYDDEFHEWGKDN